MTRNSPVARVLLLTGLLLTGLLLGAMCVGAAQGDGGASASQPVGTYKPKYQTVAHRIMKLHLAVPGTRPNYRLLDSLIDRVKAKVRLKKAYTREEALAILKTIDTVLIESNFFVPDSEDVLLLPESLALRTVNVATLRTIKRPKVRNRALRHVAEKFHHANCSTYSFLYLGIADALGLPLRGVLAPRHMFVRWSQGDGQYINWETTDGSARTDAYYKRLLGISDAAVRKGMYLVAIREKGVLASAYDNRGIAHRKKGEYDRAIADYTKAIALKPDLAEAYNNRGIAYGKKGEYDRVIADFTKAIALRPDFANAYYNRGVVYGKKGEYDRAIADFTKAIALKPAFAEAYNNRGNAYEGKGEHDRAIADYTKAIALKPDDASAYYNRGVVCGKKGEHDREIADYTKAVALKPDYASAYNNRAVAYYYKRNYQKAWADVRMAQKLGGKVHSGFLAALRKASGRSK